MTGDVFWSALDRTTIAYLMLGGLAVTVAVIAVRGVRSRRFETRRRAGSGSRAQFEKKRRRR
jgi:hypothetical protein